MGKTVKISVIFSLFLCGCEIPPKHKWVTTVREKCWAMGGKVSLSDNNNMIECYRTTVFMREPKLLFKESYGP